MKSYTLNIGDLVVSESKLVTYKCLGIGSCIGLFVQDRITGISGGAHILLPTATPTLPSTDKFYSVGSALHELLKQFETLGSTLQTLRAKVTGGANVIATGFEVGAQNTTQVLEELIQHRIFIAAQDLGGHQSRTANFDAQTGRMTVRFSQTQEYRIY